MTAPTLPREIYSSTVLSQAMKDYASICDVQVVETTSSRITLRVTPKDGVPSGDGQDLAAEFFNYVLDLAALEAQSDARP